MKTKEGILGIAVLSLGNVVGMIDLVALPYWISGLMKAFHFDPQQAGLQVTLYLTGLFLASVVLAPRFHKIMPRLTATLGYGVAAAGFFALLSMPSSTLVISALHFIAGAGAGVGLSSIHGTIGRSSNPSKLFAIASFVLGATAIPFFAIVPKGMETGGIQYFFTILAAAMGIVSVLCALVYPPVGAARDAAGNAAVAGAAQVRLSPEIRKGVALAFIGVAMMTMGQTMAYSFVDSLGEWRGFTHDQIARVFVIGSFINMTGPLVAALLLKHVRATKAATVALCCHAALTLTYTLTPIYLPFLIACSCFVFFIIFGHTFMFGMIARLDPTGRASASTPAMLMIGSMIGPVVGGTIIKMLGYPPLGFFTAASALGSALCFYLISRSPAGVRANANNDTGPLTGAAHA